MKLERPATLVPAATPDRACGATRPTPQRGGEARLPLPAWAHLPGTSTGADEAPLEAAKELVPARYPFGVPADDPAFLYGLALHEGGFFWEAHEVWEAVWMATTQNGRDRQALRGLIQLANAGLKLRMGRHRAALRLLEEARFRLQDVGRGRDGAGVADRLDCEGLAGDVEKVIERLGTAPPQTVLPLVRARFNPEGKCMSPCIEAG